MINDSDNIFLYPTHNLELNWCVRKLKTRCEGNSVEVATARKSILSVDPQIIFAKHIFLSQLLQGNSGIPISTDKVCCYRAMIFNNPWNKFACFWSYECQLYFKSAITLNIMELLCHFRIINCILFVDNPFMFCTELWHILAISWIILASLCKR